MNPWFFRFLRFVAGFALVAITCALVLDRAVLKEQLIILTVAAIGSDLICAFCDRALKAFFRHWNF